MMKRSQPNLTNVAKLAGVSIATVSRALNGNSNVVAETRDRVLAAATEIGYMPDPRFRLMAKSRSTKRPTTGNLALLLEGITEAGFVGSSHHARLFWGLESAATDQGWQMILSTLRAESDQYLPEFVRDFKVDGVIAVTYSDGEITRRISECMPMVMVNRHPGSLEVNAVLPDNASGCRQAMDYLVELGHRRIAYFLIDDSPHHEGNHAPRRDAFAAYIRQHGLSEARSVVLKKRTKPLYETIYEVLAGWQSAGELPTALLCSTDIYAIEFMKAAEELGISVPEDLSLIGTDDNDFCQYTRPALTSIRQPFEKMGEVAIKMLLDQIEAPDGADTPRLTTSMDVALVKRESCAPPSSS